MGCGKYLAQGEKVLVIREINKPVAKRINHCVMTEIGKSVRILGKILEKRNLGLIGVVWTYCQCMI